MAYKSKALAKLGKKLNARMRSLEKHGIESPAYRSVQGMLEMLGVRQTTARGRRFSESGKFRNKNEALQVERIMKQFEAHATATVTGYRKYRKSVLESAERRFGLKEIGITEDEYMQIWEALPDDERGRLYGSDETVQIVAAVLKTQRGMKEEDQYSVKEIVDRLQNSKDLKTAVASLGLSASDVVNDLGAL